MRGFSEDRKSTKGKGPCAGASRTVANVGIKDQYIPNTTAPCASYTRFITKTTDRDIENRRDGFKRIFDQIEEAQAKYQKGILNC